MLGTGISAGVAVLITYGLFALNSKYRFLLYGIPFTRTIIFFLVVADASRYHWDMSRLQGWLYCRLLASGLAQDLPAYWAYVRKPPEKPSCAHAALSQWALPLLVMFPALNFASYMANKHALERGVGWQVGGALAGTMINMLFFYYSVRRQVLRGGDAEMHYSKLAHTSKKMQNANDCERYGLPLVPSLLLGGYLFGIGHSLAKSGVALSVAVSVIPVTSFVAIPIGRLLDCCKKGGTSEERIRANTKSARRKALTIYVAICFNNTLSSWIMLALSYIPPSGPWMWSLPVITLFICIGVTISLYCFMFKDEGSHNLWYELLHDEPPAAYALRPEPDRRQTLRL